ncbi:hypothetical protein GCM10022243_33500 [Saccharothrix violaceirubra]|uniref:PE family protein n=1 Tax=Saccharothrix violaceirubra TaxID=413306 RepID=A0A7W7T0A7_9PSEU|nr:hypothetical protein [Saccharothrix violaceirubra]MBB4964199.1 hypothetical protein [Saccharothrix violaceirubra]
MFDAGGGGGKVEFLAETVTGGAAGSALVGSQTKFSVDPAQARKLIDGLRAALDKLISLYDESGRLESTQPPGKDIYSGFAALAIRRAAGTEVGGYAWANMQAREALTKTIANIEAALAQYEATDGVAEQGMKG